MKTEFLTINRYERTCLQVKILLFMGLNCCECITIPVLSNFVRIGKNWNTYIQSSE